MELLLPLNSVYENHVKKGNPTPVTVKTQETAIKPEDKHVFGVEAHFNSVVADKGLEPVVQYSADIQDCESRSVYITNSSVFL